MTNLQVLYLNNNRIAELPDQIDRLTNFKVLNLEGNELSIPDFIISNRDNPHLIINEISKLRSAALSEGNEDTVQNHEQANTRYENEVFVSYAWEEESEHVVDELEIAFAKRGIRILRDKKDLGYKGSIEEFEERLGKGQCIILVISDEFLRSEHCMNELMEVERSENLHSRIFPVVLPSSHIYRGTDRVDYIHYWEEQIEQLNQAIKKSGVLTGLSTIIANLEKLQGDSGQF